MRDLSIRERGRGQETGGKNNLVPGECILGHGINQSLISSLHGEIGGLHI